MTKPEEPSLMDSMFESLGSINKMSEAKLVTKDCTDVDLPMLIGDNIVGLLSEEKLTIEQVALLQALLQVVRL